MRMFWHRYAVRFTHTMFWVATGVIMQVTKGSSALASAGLHWFVR